MISLGSLRLAPRSTAHEATLNLIEWAAIILYTALYGATARWDVFNRASFLMHRIPFVKEDATPFCPFELLIELHPVWLTPA
jgi:hypothetical protein